MTTQMSELLNLPQASGSARPKLTGELRARLVVRYRDTLEREGFAHLSGVDVHLLSGDADTGALLTSAASAPADSAGGDDLRFRYYRQAIFQPWSGRLDFLDPFGGKGGSEPFTTYFQAATVNADQGGKLRRFAPLPDALAADPLLLGLVRTLFAVLPGERVPRSTPVLVGLHLIRLESDGTRMATSSPNHFHTDGEPWTFVVLLERRNLTPESGKSYVAKRTCAGKQPQDVDSKDVLAQFTLSTPLEALVVDDARVSHHVTGVLGHNCEPGSRTVLLMDFSPLTPERTA